MSHLKIGHNPVDQDSLVYLLRTACCARARCCALSFAHLPAHLLLSSWESGMFLSNFQHFLNYCDAVDVVMTVVGELESGFTASPYPNSLDLRVPRFAEETDAGKGILVQLVKTLVHASDQVLTLESHAEVLRRKRERIQNIKYSCSTCLGAGTCQ